MENPTYYMKVELIIDLRREDQLSALETLRNSLIGELAPAPQPQPQPEPKPEAQVPAEETKKRTRTRKAAEPAPEPAPEPESAPAAKEEDPEPELPGMSLTVEEVREKLKEKVSEHRAEIKAKLTELGAPNVSSLDPAKYETFANFLDNLS